MWKKIILIVGLTVLMIGQANAQSISIGPQVGYYRAQDADEGNFMGGVTWRFKGSSIFGIEASINYRQERYANNSLTVRSWPVMVTGLIYPAPVFYGAIGAGWYNTTYDYNQDKFAQVKDKTTQEFGWHFGAGVEIPVRNRFKVIGDIRYVFLNYDFEAIPGSNDLKSNFYVITAGFLFNIN
jgi:opacity protein-like surface antigen